MMRLACPASLLLLAACSQAPAPRVALAPTPAVCRVGPDGAPSLSPGQRADRGIGGTGGPLQVADRGIGGTGIIGVITGFASVCVAGEEVALPPRLPAEIDGAPAGPGALRAGQVIAMSATGLPSQLSAQRIDVRHAVIGPVQSVAAGNIVVAGQRVTTASGLRPVQAGEWVAVSGLRGPDDAIAATRIDPAPPGTVLVRGELLRTFADARIGSLPLRLPEETAIPAGFHVTATGHMVGNELDVDHITRDIAADSPSAYFGPAVQTFIVESEATAIPGGILVGRDFIAGGTLAAGGGGRAPTVYHRRADGSLAPSMAAGPGASARFSPAPVPHGGGPGGTTGLHGDRPDGGSAGNGGFGDLHGPAGQAAQGPAGPGGGAGGGPGPRR